ncbi:transmembrane protein C5orf28-like [Arapaima gigas]
MWYFKGSNGLSVTVGVRRARVRHYKTKSESPSLTMAGPLNLLVETEKAQALLQTFSTTSLVAGAGLGLFCLVTDHLLQLPLLLHHPWLWTTLDTGAHAVVGFWSWAIVIGLRKRSDFYEVVLAGFLASVIDLDHFYLSGFLWPKVT